MVIDKFAQFNPIIQALLGTAFTYAMTTLGAAGVFLSKELKRKWLDAMPPYMGGGEMIEQVTFAKTTFNAIPYKFEAGTPNF